MKRGVYLFPNLFTTGNLFMGFYSIVASLKGRFELAAWAIIVAMFFDVLDGKVARLMGATSSFGIQYDSLADLVSFGVAPGLLAYHWVLAPLGRMGWLTAFFFLTCGALRLARFNIQGDTPDKNRYFQGLPIPAAALAIAASYLFEYRLGVDFPPRVLMVWITVLVLGTAFLMVSNVKYRAFKEMDPARRHPFGALFLAVLILFILASEPHISFFIFSMAYILSGPAMSLVRARHEVTQMETEI